VGGGGASPGPDTPSVRYLDGTMQDQVLAQQRAGSVSWLLANHQGSITDILNAAGAVVDHIKYDSFGKILSETHAEAGSRYKYTGREFDAETGLYYYRA